MQNLMGLPSSSSLDHCQYS